MQRHVSVFLILYKSYCMPICEGWARKNVQSDAALKEKLGDRSVAGSPGETTIVEVGVRKDPECRFMYCPARAPCVEYIAK
jgi:hypothetical protein